MKLRKTLFLGVVGCIAFANPVLAQSSLPGIQSVSVQCVLSGGVVPPEFLTVQVTFVSLVNFLTFEFRDVVTGQTKTYTPAPGYLTVHLPVPPGTYNLTVKQVSGTHPQALWNNIVVPPTVSTNGRGTGCQFVSETPASGVHTPAKQQH